MKYVLIFFISISIVNAQYINVRVSSTSSTDDNEVAIAINPANPLQMMGGANINKIYITTNGGINWTQKSLTSSTFGVWGDPSVIYDRMGNVYYGHLSYTPSPGYWIDRIVVQKSTNNGSTWNEGTGIGYNSPKEQDKEWLAIEHQNNQYRDNIYVSWTEFDNYGSTSSLDSSRILFSRSTDGGLTFSNPVKVSDRSGDCIDEDNTVEGAVTAIGPNGELYISWSGPLGIMFDKSTNGGVTWGVDIFVSSQPGGWDYAVPGINRCNGLPVTACDTSHSPYRGNIYVNWSDQRNGTDNTDIFLSKSTDGGNTWSAPKKVNNDNTSRHQFFTWMAIDQKTGTLYFVFYDRRNTTASYTDVYLGISRDGGETFENHLISQSSFNPNAGTFFGDYTNIAAWDRIVRPIWMRGDGSNISAWTALIFDSSAVIPVELISFNARVNEKEILLNWKTSSEKNNKEFLIEKFVVKYSGEKTNENLFESKWNVIGKVQGKGTTTELNEYQFKDVIEKSGVFKYRIKQVDFNGSYKYSNEIEIESFTPKMFLLEQNYPNPFNPSTTICYQLPEKTFVTIKIFDSLGKEITTLINEEKQAGVYEVNFNAGDLSSGVYCYKLTTEKFSAMKKMLMLK